MAATYDEAVAELFRGPHATFVAERKRLAGELKAAGDKAGAATFAKLGRPPISAWAVNQLWWQARPEFDAFLETARRMREGDLSATPAHRESIQALRTRAAALLTEAGNAANEATLRRVATTLSAIAAHGGFAPDLPGALSDDRDPPGFEAAGIPATVVAAAPAVAEEAGPSEEERLAALRELERVAAEKLRRELELKGARVEVERIREVISSLQRQVLDAEGQLVQARARVSELENG
ncbi:MAG: hypothetical protein Q8N23_14655 [Archangium sp.]|nr:hypothetical protein [Archangium sp.]MDP3575096.1 hypothetical protein [Archangium sp.]